MKCQKCGKDTFLPFKCPFCGGYYCSQHRLPENHDCAQLDKARLPKEQVQPVISQESFEHTVTYPSYGKRKRPFSSSRREIAHLTVGALLIIIVGLSLVGFANLLHIDHVVLSVFVAAFTASFLVHEMAHKLMAQKLGLWAEFRLNLMGMSLTLLSIISPLLKIISPGAVVVAGSTDSRIMGKTSIVGPTTNMLFAGSFMVAAVFLHPYNDVLADLTLFNSWIAVFNLIPFGVFDGLKIFAWDKRIWTLVFAVSVALLIIALRPFL